MTNYPRVGIGIILFNSKNEILLGKRINSHGESTYGNPGGHLEFAETFEECIIREVLEETNLIIKDPKFLAVTNDVFEKEQKHYISIFLKAHCLNEHELQNLEPHKVESWQRFALDKLPDNLFLPLQKLINKKGYLCERSTGQAPWYLCRPKGRVQAVLAPYPPAPDVLYTV